MKNCCPIGFNAPSKWKSKSSRNEKMPFLNTFKIMLKSLPHSLIINFASSKQTMKNAINFLLKFSPLKMTKTIFVRVIRVGQWLICLIGYKSHLQKPSPSALSGFNSFKVSVVGRHSSRPTQVYIGITQWIPYPAF